MVIKKVSFLIFLLFIINSDLEIDNIKNKYYSNESINLKIENKCNKNLKYFIGIEYFDDIEFFKWRCLIINIETPEKMVTPIYTIKSKGVVCKKLIIANQKYLKTNRKYRFKINYNVKIDSINNIIYSNAFIIKRKITTK
jgi:hypothetical protein